VQFVQLESNLKIMLNVFKQLQKSKVKFTFISSQLAEDYTTVYGATKNLGEIWTKLLDGINVRLWNVYGAYEQMNVKSHVVSDFIWQAISNGKIEMLTTGIELRQFIYIDDVCDALYLTCKSNYKNISDITSFEWISIKEIADIIASLTNSTVVPGLKMGKTPITPMVGKIPGWNAKVKLIKGLQRTIELYKSLNIKK